MVQSLLFAAADANERDGRGNTPLRLHGFHKMEHLTEKEMGNETQTGVLDEEMYEGNRKMEATGVSRRVI